STAASNQPACLGSAATFSIAATGTNLTYQWLRADSLLSTNTTLVLTNVSVADAGSYQIIVNDSCNDAVTNSANLVVLGPLMVTTPPASQTNCAGESVSFNVGAIGAGLSYAWFHGGLLLGTNSNLMLTNLGAADAGDYQVVV